MVFSPSGSLVKADYYEYTGSKAYKSHGFNKARFIGSNRMQVAAYSMYQGHDTPIAIYNIANSTIT